MTALDRNSPAFKRAVIYSSVAHMALFLFILFSPHLPKSPKKDMIHYVSVVSFPGGGGGGPAGGGGEEKIAETPIPKRETLKDLTTLQKLAQKPTSSLRHPVEKPKKEKPPKKEKKAAIQKQKKVAEEAKPASISEAGSGKEKSSG